MPQDNLEPIGVEAVVEGINQFLNNMKQMEGAYDKTKAASGRFVSAANQTGGATQKMGGAFSTLLSPLRAAQNAMSTFTSGIVGGAGLAVGMKAANLAISAVLAPINMFIGAATSAASAAVSFAMGGMQLAGSFQEMEFSALAVGRSMGLQREEIEGAVKDINDLGIRYDVAAKTVAQFARNQIDLAQANDLVRIAQGSAILIGEDSSATMERLTWAVTTQNTMMLRRMGIMTDLQAAEERYAESIGTTADSLTNAQKVQSAVNEIIASGSSLLDVYDAAMESPTKRLRSLTGRILPEFQAALGAPFLDAWSTVIKAISSFVESLHGAITEGGALYPVMINLGAGASLLADGFSSALGAITNSVDQMHVGVNERLGTMVSDMFNWGVNLVASFAEGLAHAIEAYVVPVIESLANILTGWFAPGSPPAILPKIDEWGAATINEWLHGMTEADFGALSKIQGVLKQVVGPETFKAASAKAMQALAGDEGALSALTSALSGEEGIHERLSAYAGEITRMIELEVQLAQANERVAAASKHLSDVQNKLAVAASEYNQMLVEGASPEALAAKKKSIKAMEAELELARRQDEEAKAGLGTLEEETALQEDRVGAILSLMEEQKKAAKAGGVAGGAGAGRMATPKIPKLDELTADLEEGMGSLDETIQAGTWKITSSISNAIEEAKARLQERIGGMFAEIQTRFSAAVAPLVSVFQNQLLPELNRVWSLIQVGMGQAAQIASQFWTTTLLPALQTAQSFILTNVVPALSILWTWLKTNIPSAVQTAATWLQTNLPAALGIAQNFIQTKAIPALSFLWTWLQTNIPIATQTAITWLQTNLPVALAAVQSFIQTGAIPALSNIVTWLQTNIPLAIQTVSDFITGTLLPGIQNLIDYFEPTFERLKIAFDETIVALQPLGPVLVELGPVVSGLAEILGHLAQAAGMVLVGALKLLLEAVAFILPHVADLFVNMVTTAVGIIEGFVDFINGAIDMIVALFTGDLDAARVGAAQVLTGLGEIFSSVFSGIIGAIQPVIDIIADLLDKIGLLQSLGISTEFLTQPFDQAKSTIGAVGGQIEDFAMRLAGIQPPAFLNPGSPTPFEIGLLGVATALTGPLQQALTLINQTVLLLNTTAMTAIQTIMEGLSNLLLIGIQPVDLALQLIRDQTIPTLLQATINAATQTVLQMGLVQTAVQLVTVAVNAAAGAFAALGSAAATAGEAIKTAMGDAKNAIKDLVKAVDKATKAFEEMQKAAEAAAAAAKEAGGNAGQASPGAGFQHGTGPWGFDVPPGYPHDSFPLRVSSGEKVFVQPRAQAQVPMQQRTNNFYMTVNSGASPGAVVRQFEVMRALVGG
jgi:hypothetical protein